MPLYYQPEPHGGAESDALDALHAAGWAVRFRHSLITGNPHAHISARKGGQRTRSHRTIRAVWDQVQARGDLPARPAPLAP